MFSQEGHAIDLLSISPQRLSAHTLLTRLVTSSLELSPPLTCGTPTSGGRKSYDYSPVKIKASQSTERCPWFEGAH